MHAGILPEYRDAISEVGLKRGGKFLPAPIIEPPHAAQMAFEISFVDEIRERPLIERGCVAIHQPLGSFEDVDERGRQNDVADTQRREKHLRKRAHVKYVLVLRQSLQRRDGPRIVSKLAVVIVLDNERAASFGPGQEFQPPGQ